MMEEWERCYELKEKQVTGCNPIEVGPSQVIEFMSLF